jgi:hypothetical protein
MATYYWVGGSGTWDATTTTNWATTSGGTGGAGVPTSADDVVFDANSDAGSAFTVTVTGTTAAPSVCRDFDANTGSALDQAMTLSLPATTARLDVHGSLTFPASNFTYTGDTGAQSRVFFRGATTGKTVTTNGRAFNSSSINFDAGGGEWTLGSALTVGNSITVQAGTFNTADYNVTTGNFGPRATVNFGSSTITCSGGTAWAAESSAVINAGTSQINCTSANANFYGAGKTYYNVTFTNTSATTPLIAGSNTFNNLTFAARAATGIGTLSIHANQTITGTLTVQSGNTDPTRRLLITSNTLGAARTITAAAIDFGAGLDFRDITAAGAAAPWDVSSLYGGDCLGNTDITFPAAKTVYWNLAGTQNWSATGWATSSGGTPAAANFPLAQDIVVFDDAGAAGTVTLNSGYHVGTIDFSARTNAVTFNMQTAGHTVYGDFLLSSAVTFNTTNTDQAFVEFIARKSVTSVDMKGRNFACPVRFGAGGGQVNLLSGFTNSNRRMGVNGCVLNLGGNEISVGVFDIGAAITQIQFNGGRIVFYRADSQCTGGGANFSYTGDPDARITTTFAVNGMAFIESNAFDWTFTGSGSVGGFNFICRKLDASGFTGTLSNNRIVAYGDVTLSPSMTLTHVNNPVFFAKSSGIQKLTTAGLVQPWPIEKQGAGALQLEDDCTVAATRTFTHTAGTIDLNGKKLTVDNFNTSNSNARTLAMNNGTLECTASGTSFTAATATNLTVTGNGTISMTSASAKTFAGGGYQNYPTLNQGGAGDLTITGANKFYNLTNSVQPATVIFPANAVTKVRNFRLRGTPGNLVTLQSSTAGQRFTLTYEP